VRPNNPREGSRPALGARSCLSVGTDGVTVSLQAAGGGWSVPLMRATVRVGVKRVGSYGAGPKVFTFDHSLGPESSQEELFHLAGKPATRSCLQVKERPARVRSVTCLLLTDAIGAWWPARAIMVPSSPTARPVGLN
jgi:hypothetical protein